jgi:hypothetical protein
VYDYRVDLLVYIYTQYVSSAGTQCQSGTGTAEATALGHQGRPFLRTNKHVRLDRT